MVIENVNIDEMCMSILFFSLTKKKYLRYFEKYWQLTIFFSFSNYMYIKQSNF